MNADKNADIDELLRHSSLGSEGVEALAEHASDDQVQEIVDRVNLRAASDDLEASRRAATRGRLQLYSPVDRLATDLGLVGESDRAEREPITPDGPIRGDALVRGTTRGRTVRARRENRQTLPAAADQGPAGPGSDTPAEGRRPGRRTRNSRRRRR